jgi:hypothetical protein
MLESQAFSASLVMRTNNEMWYWAKGNKGRLLGGSEKVHAFLMKETLPFGIASAPFLLP